jgi:PAS domain S-box-containing protein
LHRGTSQELTLDPLAEAQLRLAAIVATSDDAIIGQDLRGTITSWNRGAEHMFGYTEAEALGQSIRMIVPVERFAEEDEVLRQIAAGQLVDRYETVRLSKDGRRLDVSSTVSPARISTASSCRGTVRPRSCSATQPAR